MIFRIKDSNRLGVLLNAYFEKFVVTWPRDVTCVPHGIALDAITLQLIVYLNCFLWFRRRLRKNGLTLLRKYHVGTKKRPDVIKNIVQNLFKNIQKN